MTHTKQEYVALEILAIQGRNLPNKDFFKKQDPFLQFDIGHNSQKTRVDKNGGTRPEWNHRIRFERLNAPVNNIMKIKCFDSEWKREAQFIGECALDLAPVFARGEEDGWFKLSDRGTPAGEIYLELTFYSEDGLKKRLSKIGKVAVPVTLTTPPTKPLAGPVPMNGEQPVSHPEIPLSSQSKASQENEIHESQTLNHKNSSSKIEPISSALETHPPPSLHTDSGISIGSSEVTKEAEIAPGSLAEKEELSSIESPPHSLQPGSVKKNTDISHPESLNSSNSQHIEVNNITSEIKISSPDSIKVDLPKEENATSSDIHNNIPTSGASEQHIKTHNQTTSQSGSALSSVIVQSLAKLDLNQEGTASNASEPPPVDFKPRPNSGKRVTIEAMFANQPQHNNLLEKYKANAAAKLEGKVHSSGVIPIKTDSGSPGISHQKTNSLTKEEAPNPIVVTQQQNAPPAPDQAPNKLTSELAGPEHKTTESSLAQVSPPTQISEANHQPTTKVDPYQAIINPVQVVSPTQSFSIDHSQAKVSSPQPIGTAHNSNPPEPIHGASPPKISSNHQHTTTADSYHTPVNSAHLASPTQYFSDHSPPKISSPHSVGTFNYSNASETIHATSPPKTTNNNQAQHFPHEPHIQNPVSNYASHSVRPERPAYLPPPEAPYPPSLFNAMPVAQPKPPSQSESFRPQSHNEPFYAPNFMPQFPVGGFAFPSQESVHHASEVMFPNHHNYVPYHAPYASPPQWSAPPPQPFPGNPPMPPPIPNKPHNMPLNYVHDIPPPLPSRISVTPEIGGFNPNHPPYQPQNIPTLNPNNFKPYDPSPTNPPPSEGKKKKKNKFGFLFP